MFWKKTAEEPLIQKSLPGFPPQALTPGELDESRFVFPGMKRRYDPLQVSLEATLAPTPTISRRETWLGTYGTYLEIGEHVYWQPTLAARGKRFVGKDTVSVQAYESLYTPRTLYVGRSMEINVEDKWYGSTTLTVGVVNSAYSLADGRRGYEIPLKLPSGTTYVRRKTNEGSVDEIYLFADVK